MNSNPSPSPRQQYSAELLHRLQALALGHQLANPTPPPPIPVLSPSPVPSTSGSGKQKKKKVSLSGPSTSGAMSEKQVQNEGGSKENHKQEQNAIEKDDSVARQMEALKKLLECPVCLQMQGVPMYLCTQGHSVCLTCRQKLLKCPMCQHPILNTRNLLVEQIIGTLDAKCPYASEGCIMKVLDVDKKKHMSNCLYRPLECSFSGSFHNCKKAMVKYSNYLKHLKTVHKMNGIQGTIMNVSQFVTPEAAKLTTDIPWHEWPVQYMDACNQTFLTGSTILDGNIFWWLYVFGDRQTADKYYCKIILHNKAKQLELSWTGPVFGIRTRPQLIKKTGLCLTVSKDVLKSISYLKTVKDSGNNETEKVAWDLVFSVFKRTGPAPAVSSPSGLNLI